MQAGLERFINLAKVVRSFVGKGKASKRLG